MVTSIHYAGQWSDQDITLGDLQDVSRHCGQDREQQVLVRFAHGAVLAMSETQAVFWQRQLLECLATPPQRVSVRRT